MEYCFAKNVNTKLTLTVNTQKNIKHLIYSHGYKHLQLFSVINDARGASLTYDQISSVVVVVVVVSHAIFSANTEPIWKILFAIDVP